ncbi:MAG: copper chaperone PCu(A)C [Betaproteobacteria bacterium]
MTKLFSCNNLGAALLTGLILAGAAQAAEIVKITDPWARATVPGQRVGGVYMGLVARENSRLTAVETAAAETAEVHRMQMENGLMRMRAVPYLALPAGTAVKLEPGGYHIMLFDLKRSLVPGQKLKVELTIEDAAKRRHRVPVEVSVRERDAGPAGSDHQH